MMKRFCGLIYSLQAAYSGGQFTLYEYHKIFIRVFRPGGVFILGDFFSNSKKSSQKSSFRDAFPLADSRQMKLNDRDLGIFLTAPMHSNFIEYHKSQRKYLGSLVKCHHDTPISPRD